MPNTSEQKKAMDIKTIHQIFENIIADLKKYPAPPDQIVFYNYQIEHLALYKESLINEVNTRKETCDHPLRAAFALEKLHFSNINAFEDNLNNFKYHSQHSGFYPTTRKAAAVVSRCLALAGAIALTVLVSGWFAILAVPIFFNLCDKTPKACKDYQDIYDAKEKSKQVYNFYSMFRRNPRPPVLDRPPAYENNLPPQQYQPYIPPRK